MKLDFFYKKEKRKFTKSKCFPVNTTCVQKKKKKIKLTKSNFNETLFKKKKIDKIEILPRHKTWKKN